MKTTKEEIKYGMSSLEDAPKIVELIAKVPEALIPVALDEIIKWIELGQSMVGKNAQGEVIAHQGMEYLSQIDVVEIRSAFVEPNYRGKGINTEMKKAMIGIAKEKYPSAKIIGFTEAASKSRGVLQKLGFEKMEMQDVPEPMFEPCPAICFKKTGKDCGCIVYQLKEGV